MHSKCILSFTALLVCLLGWAFFDSSVAGAAETVLIPEGATWKYYIGTNEPSPADRPAWRQKDFNDTSWPSGQMPVGYSNADPKTGHEATIATQITPTGVGVTLYFRKTFVLSDVANLTALNWEVWADDAAVVAINGEEVGRINAPGGELTYNATCLTAGEEITTSGTYTNKSNLFVGNNVLTIHALNSPTASSDFFAEGTLSAVQDTEPPTIVDIIPAPGSTNRTLSEVEIFFSEPVTGVDASDLLINGVAATGIEFGLPGQFVFSFPAAPAGTVTVQWASNHGITDMAPLPHPFVAGAPWTYVVDPNLVITELVLNEFMAVNQNGIHDEDGDNSDWIEIYNPGATLRDIGGWFLTDSAANLSKWRFPAGASVPANGYLVVFASNKNKTNVTGRLHTNFQLAQGGEYLALVNPQTNVVSEYAPAYPAQTADVSYGRDAGDITQLGFFTTPTPGARNQSRGPGFAAEVQFSRPSGTFVMTAPWDLVLTTATTNAQIRYAFGTNVPTATSNLYSGPIRVTNAMMIRARAFAPGLQPGPVVTKCYISMTNATNVINFSSPMPILILHNLGQGAFPASTTSERHVMVQTFEPGLGASSMTNEPTLAEFGIAHLRGSSTLGYAKGSFFMEIQDEFRADKEVPMLGLPDESDWILYAPNNFEPALFHNPLAHQLARDQGEYASRTRLVEVFLKDDATIGPITYADYNGIYVLEEKIKRDNNRVNLPELQPEQTNLPEISGGYMFSIDRSIPNEPTLAAGGANLNYIDPAGHILTNAVRQPGLQQLNYIRNYFNNFATQLNATGWTNTSPRPYADYIDVHSWVRRHVHEVVTFNVDALRLSGYLFKDRNKKIEYGPAWDYDRTQGSTDGRDFNPRTWRSNTGDLGTDFFNFLPWWGRLFNDPDFWQAWIDEYRELRDGPLSLQNVTNRIEQLAAQIRPLHSRELARWNIGPRTGLLSGDGFSYNFGTNGYENEVRWKYVWYSNRLDFIDSNFLARPTMSFGAGVVATGASLTISPAAKPGSSLIYTLNGTDPRAPGGGMAAGAFSNNGPVTITITDNLRVFARSWNPNHANLTGANRPPISSRWSPPAQGTYYTHLPPLRITEIMYHPQNPPTGPYVDEDFEYIEFRNISSTPLNVQGYKISGGVDFVFPNMVLTNGQRVVVVRNRAAFQQRYGTGPLIAGEYTNVLSVVDGTRTTNSLDNAGERLVLEGRLGERILDFEYDDAWYPITDGFGFSLVIVDDQADPGTWGLKTSWRPSGELDGSPGSGGGQSSFPPVVINEVLTHSDPPPPTDTIELANLSGSPANISGWFLTDDFRDPKKFRIPDNTIVPANGFVLFDEDDFNVGARSFSLSSLGEEVYLFSGDGTNVTGYVHGFDFGPAENGRTFGRYIISTGADHYPSQSVPTLGAANAGPLISPIVISEINYHPPDFRNGNAFVDNDIDEYIELQNTADGAIPLYDTLRPTNTWRLRDAVDYDFPLNVSIPAGGFLLVVGFDPANTQKLDAFRARNGVPPSLPVYGPWNGKLDNSGEAVELRRPDVPEPAGPPNFGLVPYILVERVRYSDQAPWPGGADGIGPTLQRVNPLAYGNDPANWVAAGPTPGGQYDSGGTPPTIIQQPTDQTAVAGTDAAMGVVASGPGLTYQWRFNGSVLTGERNATLQLPNVQVSQQGNYDVVVMNPSGSRISSNAFLRVQIPIAIATHPIDQVLRGTNDAANYGKTFSNAVFNVSVVSGYPPITYQWYFQGNPLPGATNASLVISNVTLVNEGPYYAIIADSISRATSSVARVVDLVTPVIMTQPVGKTVAVGDTATMQVNVTGNPFPIGYRWRRSGNLYTNVVINQTNHSITLNGIRTNDFGTYTVIVTNAATAGTAGILSSNAYLTVVVPHTNQTADAGTDVTFRPTIFAIPPSSGFPAVGYQWRFNGNPIAGATSNFLTLTNVQGANAGTYSITISVTGPGATPPIAPATFAATLSVNGGLTLASPQLLVNGTFTALLQAGGGTGTYTVEVSTNLIDWTTLTTVNYTNGPTPFSDPGATNSRQRFYRARQ
jgi:hypothetical protein